MAFPSEATNCAADLEAAVARHNQYTAARGRRGIYRDDDLHLAVLRLALSLMLTPGGRLDPAYADKLPLLRRMQNVPHALYHHLSHRECALTPARRSLQASFT